MNKLMAVVVFVVGLILGPLVFAQVNGQTPVVEELEEIEGQENDVAENEMVENEMAENEMIINDEGYGNADLEYYGSEDDLVNEEVMDDSNEIIVNEEQ